MWIYVNGVGLLGPGLPGWEASREVLLSKAQHQPNDLPEMSGAFLPATERRRAGKNTRLAVGVASEAITHSGISPHEVATVFATSSADTDVVHAICETLASADRQVSPTRFHNSVHNAAAGYWSIAAGSRQPSTSIAWYDKSVAAGLLEAATQATVEQIPVLLVVCEIPFPEPLASAQPVVAPFGAALLLSPTQTSASIAHLAIELSANTAPSPNFSGSLEELRRGNFAARILPLLRALASGDNTHVTLEHAAPNNLLVECTPCR